MKTTSDIFLEYEGITKMTFSHFKHASLRSIHFFFFQKNLLVIIVTPNHLSIQFKMSFKDGFYLIVRLVCLVWLPLN
jgi:hypothetical protein